MCGAAGGAVGGAGGRVAYDRDPSSVLLTSPRPGIEPRAPGRSGLGQREVPAHYLAPHPPGARVVETVGIERALDAEPLDDGESRGGERLERVVVELGGRGRKSVGVDTAVQAVLLGEARPDLRLAQGVRQELVQASR